MSLTRSEHDLLGERQIPADALWGIHTLRARENFPISGTLLSACPDLIRALCLVKAAAARANGELGLLPAAKVQAIAAACAEIAAGAHHEHFVVDVIQGGAAAGPGRDRGDPEYRSLRAVLGRAQARGARRGCATRPAWPPR